ncbi:MAG: hypothetical protein U0516_02720 [Candidatus Saccharibacteria bacterium]
MPLVTVTCTDRYFPPDKVTAGYEMQERVYEFGQLLPPSICRLMQTKGKMLGLDPETPEIAVQVDFQKYHRRAINAVDIWTKIKFTEPDPGKEKRIIVRDQLIVMIDDLLLHRRIFHNNTFTWAIDGFFDGPGFGCIGDQSGRIIQKW